MLLNKFLFRAFWRRRRSPRRFYPVPRTLRARSSRTCRSGSLRGLPKALSTSVARTDFGSLSRS